MLPPSMVGLPYFREEIEDGESKVSCPSSAAGFIRAHAATSSGKGKRQILYIFPDSVWSYDMETVVHQRVDRAKYRTK